MNLCLFLNTKEYNYAVQLHFGSSNYVHLSHFENIIRLFYATWSDGLVHYNLNFIGCSLF